MFRPCSQKHRQFLTCHHRCRSVLLGVAVLQADGAGVGFGLVSTQRLPLLFQTVLVLQVILHVGLQEKMEEGEHRLKRDQL